VGAERRSKVAYDLEERSAGLVRLTVTHHGFVPGSRCCPLRAGLAGRPLELGDASRDGLAAPLA